MSTPRALPGAAGRAATLGVLGGGQLGRMFVHAAQTLGYRVCVLEPDPASPAAAAADEHLRSPYTDAAALQALAQRCAAVTTEFENVPAASLRQLAQACSVSPPAAAVEICQHRAREKQAFRAAGVPCAPFRCLDNPAAVQAAVAAAADGHDDGLAGLLPGILKTASLGYDGKGQAPVQGLADLQPAFAALGGVPCVLEQRLPLAAEISVILARGADGQTTHLPPQRNVHRQGILAFTQVPAQGLTAETLQHAAALAQRLAESLSYVGVLCVEFFVLQDGSLVANEMAPRPHNSGHYSIDACDVSQFDLQVRALAGLPLVPPRQHSAAVMLNLLGDLWFRQPRPDDVPPVAQRARTHQAGPADRADQAGQASAAPAPADGPDTPAPDPVCPDWAAVLALPGAHLHLYGKAQPRPGRKMGHLTLTAPDPAQALARARQAARALGLPDPAADLPLD